MSISSIRLLLQLQNEGYKAPSYIWTACSAVSNALKFPFDFKKSGEGSAQLLFAKCILTHVRSVFPKINISMSVVHFAAQVCSLIAYCHLESNMHVHADRKKILRDLSSSAITVT